MTLNRQDLSLGDRVARLSALGTCMTSGTCSFPKIKQAKPNDQFSMLDGFTSHSKNPVTIAFLARLGDAETAGFSPDLLADTTCRRSPRYLDTCRLSVGCHSRLTHLRARNKQQLSLKATREQSSMNH